MGIWNVPNGIVESLLIDKSLPTVIILVLKHLMRNFHIAFPKWLQLYQMHKPQPLTRSQCLTGRGSGFVARLRSYCFGGFCIHAHMCQALFQAPSGELSSNTVQDTVLHMGSLCPATYKFWRFARPSKMLDGRTEIWLLWSHLHACMRQSSAAVHTATPLYCSNSAHWDHCRVPRDSITMLNAGDVRPATYISRRFDWPLKMSVGRTEIWLLLNHLHACMHQSSGAVHT